MQRFNPHDISDQSPDGCDASARKQYPWCVPVPVRLEMMSIDPKTTALFLDVDGTLVDIRELPAEVTAPDDLLATLATLLEIFDGAIAIVSGRQIRDVDRILAPLEFVAAGVHGIQLRFARGGPIETTAPRLPAKLVASIRERLAGLDGIAVEPKDEAVAVHFRLAPQHRIEVGRILTALVEEYGRQLEVSQGRMVFEVVPRSCSKGQALARLARLAPFAGRMPIMIGDDAPDVSAIRIAKELRGIGLTVGGEYFPRDKADFKNPEDVRAWLRSLTKLGTGN